MKYRKYCISKLSVLKQDGANNRAMYCSTFEMQHDRPPTRMMPGNAWAKAKKRVYFILEFFLSGIGWKLAEVPLSVDSNAAAQMRSMRCIENVLQWGPFRTAERAMLFLQSLWPLDMKWHEARHSAACKQISPKAMPPSISLWVLSGVSWGVGSFRSLFHQPDWVRSLSSENCLPSRTAKPKLTLGVLCCPIASQISPTNIFNEMKAQRSACHHMKRRASFRLWRPCILWNFLELHTWNWRSALANDLLSALPLLAHMTI